ncbi:MAG TPA: MaoC family dehydratase [Thermoanaerobaculia bacterium]|nr:MaoC family dehydratase [Thermoanaerobaculia bacterium]
MTEPLAGPFEHRPIAFNFATASSNKIHDDETARRFGFAGGLVPGVAVYGYLVAPVVQAFGGAWCERGAAAVRFDHPVYEGDRVTARATRDPAAPSTRLTLELFDGDGTRCASGWASLPVDGDPEGLPAPALADLPAPPLPEPDRRPPAGLGVLRPGTVLGAYPCGPWSRAELAEIARRYRDPGRRWAADAEPPALHPAHLLDAANQLLVANVLLGPWIHVASEVRHLHRLDPERPHRMRGRVAEAQERKGHEIVRLELALFDDADRAIATASHTAIVRPRQRGG